MSIRGSSPADAPVVHRVEALDRRGRAQEAKRRGYALPSVVTGFVDRADRASAARSTTVPPPVGDRPERPSSTIVRSATPPPSFDPYTGDEYRVDPQTPRTSAIVGEGPGRRIAFGFLNAGANLDGHPGLEHFPALFNPTTPLAQIAAADPRIVGESSRVTLATSCPDDVRTFSGINPDGSGIRAFSDAELTESFKRTLPRGKLHESAENPAMTDARIPRSFSGNHRAVYTALVVPHASTLPPFVMQTVNVKPEHVDLPLAVTGRKEHWGRRADGVRTWVAVRPAFKEPRKPEIEQRVSGPVPTFRVQKAPDEAEIVPQGEARFTIAEAGKSCVLTVPIVRDAKTSTWTFGLRATGADGRQCIALMNDPGGYKTRVHDRLVRFVEHSLSIEAPFCDPRTKLEFFASCPAPGTASAGRPSSDWIANTRRTLDELAKTFGPPPAGSSAPTNHPFGVVSPANRNAVALIEPHHTGGTITLALSPGAGGVADVEHRCSAAPHASPSPAPAKAKPAEPGAFGPSTPPQVHDRFADLSLRR